jgi:hypothetical protein
MRMVRTISLEYWLRGLAARGLWTQLARHLLGPSVSALALISA